MGVLRSSFFNMLGELTIGLSSSDGKVPEPGVQPGVRRDDAVLDRLSNPAAAAMVAVAVADAMIIACRRLQK